MDSINNYASSDEEGAPEANVSKISSTSIKINSAPDVGGENNNAMRLFTAPTTSEVPVNIPYSDMMLPTLGPDNPFTQKKMATQNVLTGHIEGEAMNEMDFRTQLRTFESYGYARDPSISSAGVDGSIGGGVLGTGYIGDVNKAIQMNGATIYDSVPKNMQPNQNLKERRKPKGDSSVLEGDNAYLGPWAGYENEKKGEAARPTDEELEFVSAMTKKTRQAKTSGEIPFGEEKTVFHGKEERDYLGRTYMAVPQDLDVNLLGEPGTQQNFIPKKCIHTWSGHTRGVSAIRFLPKSAHLLLSAGMDNKIKIWDVYHDRQCLRTMMGHGKAVRDITFSNDGRRFLSASYDKTVKLWDTETGKCISSFTTGKIPYTVKFNPDEDKQHIFLAGCADKKIVQFDINTGEVTQEYDQHLGAINTITFVDDNRRFISTSDDKTLRAWEFDIPVVIKYVAEPDMHSMPAVALHPNKKWLACTSLDNQIVVFGARDRFRQNRKKRFAGHMVAGYACQPGFSPDGRFISSGDADGNVWFWDWKTCRIIKKFKAHDKVVINTEWNPHETSKMATCSWDGLIKYWD